MKQKLQQPFPPIEPWKWPDYLLSCFHYLQTRLTFPRQKSKWRPNLQGLLSQFLGHYTMVVPLGISQDQARLGGEMWAPPNVALAECWFLRHFPWDGRSLFAPLSILSTKTWSFAALPWFTLENELSICCTTWHLKKRFNPLLAMFQVDEVSLEHWQTFHWKVINLSMLTVSLSIDTAWPADVSSIPCFYDRF